MPSTTPVYHACRMRSAVSCCSPESVPAASDCASGRSCAAKPADACCNAASSRAPTARSSAERAVSACDNPMNASSGSPGAWATAYKVTEPTRLAAVAASALCNHWRRVRPAGSSPSLEGGRVCMSTPYWNRCSSGRAVRCSPCASRYAGDARCLTGTACGHSGTARANRACSATAQQARPMAIRPAPGRDARLAKGQQAMHEYVRQPSDICQVDHDARVDAPGRGHHNRRQPSQCLPHCAADRLSVRQPAPRSPHRELKRCFRPRSVAHPEAARVTQ